MRLGSSLCSASVVLYACVDARSTRSISMPVTLPTHDQHNVPAQRFLRESMETNQEERVFNIPGLNEAIASVKPMASSLAENTMYWVLRASDKSADDAYTFLRLDKADDNKQSKLRFAAWIKYVAEETKPLSQAMIAKALGHYGDKGLVKVLDAYAKVKARKAVVDRVESTLMNFWKGQQKSAEDVFFLLKLDQPFSDTLLKTWVKYVKTNTAMPDMAMGAVIARCNDAPRLMILEGLKKIADTETVVTNLETLLLRSFVVKSYSANEVFRMLHLNDGVKELFKNPNLDLFERYAVILEPSSTKEASLVTASRKSYGDIPLASMLEVWKYAKDPTAKTTKMANALRYELFRQWAADKEHFARNILPELSVEIRSSYNAFLVQKAKNSF